MLDASESSDKTHRKDSSDAINDATPETMIVAYVSFEPVPRDTPSGISRVKEIRSREAWVDLISSFGGFKQLKGRKS